MGIRNAIKRADSLLPGIPAPNGENDPRWQGIIEVSEYIQSNPDAVWAFAARWGIHENDDVRMAIATCILEHLLEYHFAEIFPKVRALAQKDANFADTFSYCHKFGQSELKSNSKRFDALMRKVIRLAT